MKFHPLFVDHAKGHAEYFEQIGPFFRAIYNSCSLSAIQIFHMSHDPMEASSYLVEIISVCNRKFCYRRPRHLGWPHPSTN